MPSVLVLGGTGMLGHVLANYLGATGFDVHASIRRRPLAGQLRPQVRLHNFDVACDSISELLDAVRPSTVINCIGLVKQLDAESRPLDAIRLNALFPHEAAAACDAAGTRLIHISTDCVFSGSLPLGRAYTEDDEPDARDTYGLTKYLGEVRVSSSLTLRTSIIGWELGRKLGLLEWFASQDGGRVHGYTRAVFTGLTTAALARVVGSLINEHPQLSGLFHVSSDPITKHDLLRALARILDLDIEIIASDQPVVNRALNSDRLRDATGLAAPPWEDMLLEYTRERTAPQNAG